MKPTGFKLNAVRPIQPTMCQKRTITHQSSNQLNNLNCYYTVILNIVFQW